LKIDRQVFKIAVFKQRKSLAHRRFFEILSEYKRRNTHHTMPRNVYRRFLQEYKQGFGGNANEARRFWRAASDTNKQKYKSGAIGIEQLVELPERSSTESVRLYRVRKEDCANSQQRKWVVGQGCFENRNSVVHTKVPKNTPVAQKAPTTKTVALVYGIPIDLIEQTVGFFVRRRGKTLNVLGSGEYGRVLLACAKNDKNQKICEYALKVIPGSRQGEIDLSRKAANLRIGPHIHSSAIVQHANNFATVIVMDQFDGTMEAVRKPLRGDSATKMADLVQRAQSACLIHKDLHQNNVMFQRDSFEWRIIDFDPTFVLFGDCSDATDRLLATGSWLFHVEHFLVNSDFYKGVLPHAAQRTPSKDLAKVLRKTRQIYAQAYDSIGPPLLRTQYPKPIAVRE
jgi:hypothetical protein